MTSTNVISSRGILFLATSKHKHCSAHAVLYSILFYRFTVLLNLLVLFGLLISLSCLGSCSAGRLWDFGTSWIWRGYCECQGNNCGFNVFTIGFRFALFYNGAIYHIQIHTILYVYPTLPMSKDINQGISCICALSGQRN